MSTRKDKNRTISKSNLENIVIKNAAFLTEASVENEEE